MNGATEVDQPALLLRDEAAEQAPAETPVGTRLPAGKMDCRAQAP